ncbi:MAG: GNAT family N-acetyltransferase [Paludibacter sp.]
MISFEYYNGLPLEYESFLIKRYDSFITTCRYIEVYYPNYEFNHMLVRDDSELQELFVYGIKGNQATCFNSLVSINQVVVAEFIRSVFEQHSTVTKIEIVASYNEYNFEKSILYFQSDNHILNLPQKIDDYFNMLGSSTRQTLKNRKAKLLRDYENVNFYTKYGSEISEEIVNRIIDLKTERQKQKGRRHKVDEMEKNNIYKFSKHYGCVSYLEVDGVIVSGSINTRLKNGMFGHITGFDPKFSKYNVGEICTFNLIQTSIENGLTTFNFLWGHSDLKRRLLGKPRFLYFYFIFRAHSFEYAFTKMKVSFQEMKRNLKQSRLLVAVKSLIRSYAQKNFSARKVIFSKANIVEKNRLILMLSYLSELTYDFI